MRHNIFLFLLITIFATSCKKTESSLEGAALQATPGANGKGTLPHTKQYSSEVATSWYTLITNISRNTPIPPPPTLRIMAYSGIALYESVVPGMPSYRSAFTIFTGNTIPFTGEPRNYYWPAAANAAMARVMTKLLADYPNPVLAANLASVQQLENSFANQFSTKATAEQLQNSVDYGRLAADAVYNWSKTDMGTFNPNGTMLACPPYSPVGGPGNWVPVAPLFLPAAGACTGFWRTFNNNINSTTMAPPPPAYSTTPGSAFYNMMHDTYQQRLNATPNDILNGEHWRDRVGTNFSTPAHMMRITVNIVNKEGLNLEDASVLFSKAGIALFDAVTSAFNGKFNYSIMRPITYIHNVLGFTTWSAQYPTIQHPSYPATMPSAASAVATILENYVGTAYSFIDSTQASLYGNWAHPSLAHLVADVARSRIQTGHNFNVATTAGISLGKAVATQTLSLPFKKE
jgi:hypothetical protein